MVISGIALTTKEIFALTRPSLQSSCFGVSDCVAAAFCDYVRWILDAQFGICGNNLSYVPAKPVVLGTGSRGSRDRSAAYSVPSGCAAFVGTRVTSNRLGLGFGGVAGIQPCRPHTA